MHTDIQIAGIKANYPAYSVAWQINQAFDMQFHMSLDWAIENKVGEVNKHIHFFEQFEDVELNWHLIQIEAKNHSYLIASHYLIIF